MAEKSVLLLIRAFGLDSRKIYYHTIGILKFRDGESGEQWFIDSVLPCILANVDNPVFLDLGANIGTYSSALAKAFPSSRCYAFEPNPFTFGKLLANTASIEAVIPVGYGAGAKKEDLNLYVYGKDRTTSHASLYKDVFLECHRQNGSEIESLVCKIDRIDNMIGVGIVPESSIHFMKIDTEGHELDALKGSLGTIGELGVRAIQFEFNEMNVFSRVFLKDFYDLLGYGWTFFRLDTQKLIKLGSRYDSANEIFKFQNIIAIREEFCQFLIGSMY